MNEKRLTPHQAIPKIKNYCAYQERCHAEVRDKLYAFGLQKNEVESLLSILIEENYLNEQRFAILFACGRFRLKQWGRVKIKYALKAKQVSDYCIRKALEEIDDEVYIQTMTNLLNTKWELLKKEKNKFIKRKKLQDYLIQRGFESDLFKTEIDKLQ